jgi:hypothetical protein
VTETDYGIILFFSTQGAIRAERVLIQKGLAAKLVPTPRQFSSDCGTALRCFWEDVDAVRGALDVAGVRYHSVHKMTVQHTAQVGR